MIPNEIQRLIYQCIMGGKVVVIAPNDELASERFEELSKAVVVAADELRHLMEEAEKVILYGGFMDSNPMGLIEDYFESIEWLPISNPQWKRKWYCSDKWNVIRKDALTQILHRPRCRWRQRESRRSLEGMSPGVVIIDECAFEEEGSC